MLNNETKSEKDVIINIVPEPFVTMQTISAVQLTLREMDLLKVNFKAIQTQDAKLILPPQKSADWLEKIPKKNKCLILVNNLGQLCVDDELMSAMQMEDHVKRRLADTPNLIVDITTSKQLNYNVYLDILNRVKNAGAQRISVGEHKKKPPAK